MSRRLINQLLAIAVASCATLAIAQAPIVLKLASPAPPRSYLHSDVFGPWIEDVNKAAGGTIKFEPHYGGTLGNFGVMYDRVVDGVADVGFIVASFAGGKFRMHEVAALPFESGPSVQASTALWRMYEKGVTRAEFSDTMPIAIWVFANAALHSREVIKTVEEVKGKRISAGNSATGKIIATLGGTPMPFRPDELYQVLQRGTVQIGGQHAQYRFVAGRCAGVQRNQCNQSKAAQQATAEKRGDHRIRRQN